MKGIATLLKELETCERRAFKLCNSGRLHIDEETKKYFVDLLDAIHRAKLAAKKLLSKEVGRTNAETKRT